ncbi:hypothetical protein AB0A73_03745 [Glycomyces sp. NPDC047369]
MSDIESTRADSGVDLAALLGSTPERVRAVLRDLGLGVGSGHRYNLAGLRQRTLQEIGERLR